MKKLITLFLAMAGMVSTASARMIYINVSDPGWWSNDYTITAISFDGGETKTNMDAIHKYGKRFRIADIPDGNTECIIYRHTYQSGGDGADGYYNEQTISLPGTADIYKSIHDASVSDFDTSAFKWAHMICRNNIKDNWSHTDDNMTSIDDNTLTYTLTKSEIEGYANYSTEGIRFRLRNGDKVIYNDAGEWVNDYPQLYPNSTEESSNGKLLSIAGNTTGYYHNTTSTQWYWQINVPSYDYEKIVITAKYINDGGYKWQISADAYISKTVSAANDYATFGTTVPVDLSVLPASVTAYTVTADASNGKITKTEKNDALAANEGVLLENLTDDDVTLSIPVAASASASSSNGLVAFTGGSDKLAQTSKDGKNNYTHYILANDTEGVGFYKVNSAGNSMGTNTAYLKVLTSVDAARSFLWFDDASGISDTVREATANDRYYNLNGQVVAQPTKGLYIVNGKKVIMK